MAQTVFNLERPRDRERIARAVEKLATRTPHDLEALHYLRTSEAWLCLDFSLSADSLENLDLAARAFLQDHDAFTVFPAAGLDLWMRMVAAPVVKRYFLYGARAARTPLIVSVCSEVARG